MRSAACLLLAACSTAIAQSPADAVRLGLADARRLDPVAAKSTRYLSLYNLPNDERARMVGVLSFHVNSLSKEAEIVPVRHIYADAEVIEPPRIAEERQPAEAPPAVGPELVAVNLRDYGIDPYVYGRLVKVEPYFHVQIDGGKAGPQAAAAPWLPAATIAELIERTQSQVPVLRADWFLVQTAIQADRVAGYYDMLGVGKSKADFDRLVGLDEAAAKRLRKEIHAIVSRSGVALGNRQIVRFQTITGAYWVTLDSRLSTGRSNAVRLLDADYQFDASEIYGTLPNGLFAYFLADRAGVRQDTAPDFIASDSVASGNDRRVHAARSCIVCHAEGIRPIDDWARAVYKPPLQLSVAEYDRAVRFRQLYASDLAAHVKRDQGTYAEAVRRCNGWGLATNAERYGQAWDAYAEGDWDLARAARDLGVPPAMLRRAIVEGIKRGPPGAIDAVLAGLVADPPRAIRAEHWEEVFPLAMAILYGGR